ncbi:sensor histidine kinase [Flexivirga meconopsidis]|uniref:sensor histidine kinase n=1 Tax=Flexivirga meconopsidis TaxID=2977121 RepID=UPI00223FEB50|nr:histidine kinase [Flexivirga meconopsidis]
MPWSLRVLIGAPLVLCALADLIASPGAATLCGVVLAFAVGWLADRVARGAAVPALAGVGAATAGLVLEVVAAQGGSWLLSIGWSLVVLAGCLASVARSRVAFVYVGIIAAAGILSPLGVPDLSVLLALGMATAMATAVGIGLQVRASRQHAEDVRREVMLRERTDMARELHDLVAHEVTGIVVLAQATQSVTDQPVVRQALARIEESGQQAMEQIRGMVQTLRTEPAAPLDLRPTGHGTSGLRSLASDFIATTQTPVEVDLAEVALSAQVDAALQRVLAEALTNIRRHAGAATRVRVILTALSPDEALLRISNDGTGVRGIGQGSGYGLAGLRERLAVVGGTLSAGRRDGEWVVEATVPIGGDRR